jgi:hypothetical protein
MRIPGRSRRWLIAGAIGLGVVVSAAIALFVVYPRVGAAMVRTKLCATLAGKLGREVRVGSIEVALGHAVVHDLEIRGPLDGDTPLVHVDRIDVEFAAWSSLVGTVVLGTVRLDGVLVTLHRDVSGDDNVRDLLDRVRGTSGAARGDGGGGLRPTSIQVTHGRLLASDDQTGATGLVADADASWTPEALKLAARGVSATTLNAPRASASAIHIDKVAGATPIVTIEGGEIALWPRLALSGIGGTLVANPERASEYIIDLAGGYGGVPGRLWTARGGFDRDVLTASVDLEAAKFQLDRLAPILAQSAVVDYAQTAVDTKIHVDVDRLGAKFAGSFHLSGLNVGHPLIAERAVHDLDLSGQIAGSFERATRTLSLTRGDFVMRDMPFSITGVLAAPPANPSSEPIGRAGSLPQLPGGDKPGNERPAHEPPRIGPHGLQVAKLRLVIPPIDCQRVLAAIPVEMAPYLAGYKVRGKFATDVQVDIDWRDLDLTQLDGHIGLRGCRVIDEPADSPRRLADEFAHSVEVAEGEWISFDVGPSNDEFVPLDQISPYLVGSIMSTEDSAFYKHHGFIPSEFRTALINNLKAGKFVQGASSITMQMVKNVLLYRDKTLARKLQELFLTWHVENTLSKDRILEIYLNAIEYGPGLYGIGPAAYHFFGKQPKDLSPVEAAFFSTILPSPKERYKQYCANTLTRWSTGKIERILQIMVKRDRLTQPEYDAAIETPLQFSRDDTESEDDCMKRVKKAIKNARPTNPLAAHKDAKPAARRDGKRDPKKDRDKAEHRDRHDRRGAYRRRETLPI